MALTAQQVADSSREDTRTLDDVTILDLVDRIHKDVLHTSVYAPFNHETESISTTTADVSSLDLSAVDVRRILSVYNRTFNQLILPLTGAVQPAGLADKEATVQTQAGVNPQGIGGWSAIHIWQEGATQGPLPRFYKHITNGAVLHLFPSIKIASVADPVAIEVYYEQQVTTLATLATALIVPEDAKDVMVAGVNYLVSLNIGRDAAAVQWLTVYENLKRGATHI